MLGNSNEIIQKKNFGAAGELRLVKNVAHSYGLTSKGRGTVKTKTSYSVYFLPHNSELEIEDFGTFTRKNEAVKAFRGAVKQWQNFFSIVQKTVAKQEGKRYD